MGLRGLAEATIRLSPINKSPPVLTGNNLGAGATAGEEV
jgi:hypothetical protein